MQCEELSQLSIVLIDVNINQQKTLFKVDLKRTKQHFVCLFTSSFRSPKPLIRKTGEDFPFLTGEKISGNMVVSYMTITDFILSFTASMNNLLLLVALYKVRLLHPPTKFLFRCLSVADFLSGFLNLVVSFQILIFPGPNKGDNTYTGYLFHYGSFVFNLSLVFYLTSIEVSTILCVDRLLALLLGLRYKEIVTLFRVRLAVAANV